MKLIKTLLTIIFISLLSSPSWSVNFDDLVKREGIYYEKFTDVPFTGKVTGKYQGVIKNGKEDGAWIGYRENGQLWYKENYKNGKKEGAWVSYWMNGQLYYKGNYKSNKKEGVWFSYNIDGTVFKPWTGTFKDGKKIRD